MQLNKHRVDTAVDVTDEETSVVNVRLSDDVVIALFRETMKGYCPVCSFNKIGTDRRICNECLEKERPLYQAMETPYDAAIIRIIRHLMPDPPIEYCVGYGATEAMTHLGVYTGCMGFRSPSRPGARRALVSLGAWVVARLSKMLEEQEIKSC